MEQSNPNYTEYNGCISTTTPSQYFSKSFLDDPIFGLIPEGFDVCYNLFDIPEAIHIEFYLYDSTVPLMRKKDDIASTISIYFEKPYRWSYGWIPFYNNTLHIPELYTNSDFEGYDMTGGGLGTFMILCAMAYSKSKNLHMATLHDASAGYRKDYNIYEKLGFNYINSDGHDMTGNVNEIYSKTSDFIMHKGDKFRKKLDELTEYFDDEEWTGNDMEMDGGYRRHNRNRGHNKYKQKNKHKYTKKNRRKQKGGTEPIYKYMKKGTYDYDKIKELLEAGANPNIVIPNHRGTTPLTKSVYYEDTKLFDLLMEYGANPFITDDLNVNTYDSVRFMERVVGNKDPEFYEKIKDNIPHYEKVILEYKEKNIPKTIKEYMKKNTYDYDKIKELLEAGADPDIIIYKGMTALPTALFYDDDHKLFDLLIEYGADPFLKDDAGNSTLDYIQAALNGLFKPTSNISKNTHMFMEKIKEKMKPKEDAATYMQSRYRGKLTRKRDYLSRYSSYKPWKGTTAIDYYLYTDEDIFNYLRQDDNNFVLKLPSTKEEKYEAWNVNDILTSLKLPNTPEPLMFYECLTAEHTIRSDNVSTDSKFMKIGGSQFIVKFPDWLYSYFIYNTTAKANRRTSAPRLPEPRIYTLKKYKEIFGLVSNKIYDYHANMVSGDHCNYPKPVWTYELVVENEEDYIYDFLTYLDQQVYDESSA